MGQASRATHYRNFAEAASSVRLSFVGSQPLRSRRWDEGSFVVVCDESTLTLLARTSDPALPWTLALSRTRQVQLELELRGASCTLRVSGDARRVQVPDGGSRRPGFDVIRITVTSAHFVRQSGERERR